MSNLVVRHEFGNWVPRKIRPVIRKNHKKISDLPLVANPFPRMGSISLVTRHGTCFEKLGAERVEALLALNVGQLIGLGPTSVVQLVQALQRNIAELLFLQEFDISFCGDWVPWGVRRFVYENRGHFEGAMLDRATSWSELGEEGQQELAQNSIRDFGDVLELNQRDIWTLFSAKYSNRNSIKVLNDIVVFLKRALAEKIEYPEGDLSAFLQPIEFNLEPGQIMDVPLPGDWIPANIQELVSTHYNELASVLVEARDFKIGGVATNVRLGHVLQRERINSLGDLLEMSQASLLAWQSFGKRCLGELGEILTKIVGELIGNHEAMLGDWVPDDLRPAILADYDKFSQIPLLVGGHCFGRVGISGQLAGVLAKEGVRSLGDLLIQNQLSLLRWRLFGSASLVELQRVLERLVESRENRWQMVEVEAIRLEQVRQALGFLGARERNAIQLHFGLSRVGFSTLSEIGERIGGFTSELARQSIERGIKELRLFGPFAILDEMNQLLISQASEMFALRTVISLKEYKDKLEAGGWVAEDDQPFVLPILFLLDQVCGSAFDFIELKKGKKLLFAGCGVRLASLPPELRIGLTKTGNFDRYLELLPPFCSPGEEDQRLLWTFGEYAQSLLERKGFVFRTEEQRLVFGQHQKIEVDKDVFKPSVNSRELQIESLVKLFKEAGTPLTIDELVRLSDHHDTRSLRNRYFNPEPVFVCVGNSRYDLRERRPEIAETIPWPLGRRSAVFMIVYSLLAEAKEPISVNDIFNKMKAIKVGGTDQAVYSWTKIAVHRVVKDPLYAGIIEERGRRHSFKYVLRK